MMIFRVITDQGKPLEKRKVSISLEGFKDGKPVGHGQIAETDQNGEARFTLPSLSLEHFFFYVELGSPYWYCSCNGIPRTEKVAQTGIVQSAASKYSHKSFEPKPGRSSHYCSQVLVYRQTSLPFDERLKICSLLSALDRGAG